MALSPGTRLGVYELTALIGEGGMGQVYRATDTKLKRQVAIKTLPPSLAADHDRLARFQREAEVLASLNHPNIAAVYGLEDNGGVSALVMELVDGEDLSCRIARGAIPLDEALPIAKQITEALEAAHDQGIIHRDLKPANIKVRPDGVVKVLDFGLAKLTQPSAARPRAPGELSQSPTITSPAMMTGAGVLLGTVAYMSPEQAKGREADKRSDIWAFGVVLYEMLTGKRAFPGGDIPDTLAAVLRAEPDWSLAPRDVSPTLLAFLRRSLEKDPKQRVGDIRDVRLALEGAFETAVSQTQTAVDVAPNRRAAIASAVALVVGALVAGLGVWVAMRSADPARPRVSRLTLASLPGTELTLNGADRDLAITPDGSHVIYVGNNGSQLLVRALGSLEPLVIATGPVRGPFVSPDSQWVGFFENGTLKKVAIAGGPSIPLTTLVAAPRGATWLPDDTIVFSTASTASLQRISAGGGTPTVLTSPDSVRGDGTFRWPEALPGGRGVLFTINAAASGLGEAQIAVFDLRTNTSTVLVRGGSHARYVGSGHLVYAAAGTLRAVPFDLNRLTVHGSAVPVVPQLVTTAFGAGDFDVAIDGTLVYVDVSESSRDNDRTLVWVDRSGKEEALAAPPRTYEYPRLSPDGTRLALSILDQEQDIWSWDLRRSTLTRLTFGPQRDTSPVWTTDGRRIVFASQRGSAAYNVWWQAADGSDTAERLTTSDSSQFPTGVSPDGRQVVLYEQTPTMRGDLMRLTLDGTGPSTLSDPRALPGSRQATGRPQSVQPRQVEPLLQSPFGERNGLVSPDGRWLAYESASSGRNEIYVRPFLSAVAGQWQVSTAGGTRPLWARDGRELFFFGADSALLRVAVEATEATWNAGSPTKLLEPRYYAGNNINQDRNYDVSPDGQRFLMIKPGRDSTAPPSVIVVQRFDVELQRLAPSN